MSKVMINRAAEAHRNSFALITMALTSPATFDPDQMLTDILDQSEDAPRAALDIIHSLVWHSVGAFLTIGGSTEGALALVQRGSIMQEVTNDERLNEDKETNS